MASNTDDLREMIEEARDAIERVLDLFEHDALVDVRKGLGELNDTLGLLDVADRLAAYLRKRELDGLIAELEKAYHDDREVT